MQQYLQDHNSFSKYWQKKIEFEDYIKQKKELYYQLLLYIENEAFSDENFQNLIRHINTQNTKENRQELREFFCLLLKISNNHFKSANFMNKIQRIISELKDNIINTFSNSEIFDIFKCNKNILLYLIKKSILTIDKAIAYQILEKSDTKYPKYHLFFASEIKQFVDFDMWSDIENELLRYNSQIFENFEINRQNGENESFICSLIRDDSVEEFISYVNRTNISFSSQIKTSIFETNSFLLKKKEPTLIEYAAFYGSIQIFQYLRLNNTKLMPSLWLYAIHGRNPELIHLLEESGVEPNDKTYEECLKMAIKCHHNDIANYIKENLLDEKIEISNLEHNYDENIVAYSFRYMNYDFIPIDLNNKFLLDYSCHYNYFKLVEILMKTKKFPLNASIIHIINLFLLQFQIYSLFIELQNHFSVAFYNNFFKIKFQNLVL